MQEIIVYIIVGIAFWYLMQRVLSIFTSKKGCGKCDSCGGASTPTQAPPQQLLQIQVKKKL